MNVHTLSAAPPPDLARALERFEEQFRYPLGPGRSFRISHLEDYPRFFRAMGEGISFVAERDGKILGVLGAALRGLILPNDEERSAVSVLYLGDLKIDPALRGGRTLLRLAAAAQQWLSGRTEASFAVVMDGTPVDPARYTGRLGIPPFAELGKITVLRLPTSVSNEGHSSWLTSESEGGRCYSRLTAGRYGCPGGNPSERSEMEPVWLMDPKGRSCGRLEDTRGAKRLIADDGVEMLSAHLSGFAYQDEVAGVELLRVARQQAALRGFPSLFVAVAAPDAARFTLALREPEVVIAPATVFGSGLMPWPLWNINTAEI